MQPLKLALTLILAALACAFVLVGGPSLTGAFMPPGDPVVLAVGDIASCDGHPESETAKLVDRMPGIVLAVGDLAYDSGTTSEIQNCYDPTWGKFRDRTRPVPGNHEYYTEAAAPYFKYFGSIAGEPAKGYYSFELGAWHLIALNSEIDVAAGSEQEQWLRQDLAAHPTRCTLAYWHRPRFSSGVNGSDPHYVALWQALYDYGADVVVSAHDHDYERMAPQTAFADPDPEFGIREFVAGTGGKSHIPFRGPVANSEVRNEDTFGVLKLSLHPDRYDWAFVPVDGKSFVDSGSAPCHDSPPRQGGAAGSTLALDSFSRTLDGGWGDADKGGSYLTGGSPAKFGVSGSAGRIELDAAGVAAMARLQGTIVRDLDARFRFQVDKLPAGGGMMISLIARQVGSEMGYLARVHITRDRAVKLQLFKWAAGTEIPAGEERALTGLQASSEKWIQVHVQIAGVQPATIRMNAWPDGQNQPAGWMYQTSDSSPELQASGGIGLRAYLPPSVTNLPIIIRFDDLKVAAIGGQ